MMGTGIGRDLVEIAALLISVSLVSMLVINAQGTSQVIGAATAGFGNLLQVATFQGAGNGGFAPLY